jgi:hypothetical protein
MSVETDPRSSQKFVTMCEGWAIGEEEEELLTDCGAEEEKGKDNAGRKRDCSAVVIPR